MEACIEKAARVIHKSKALLVTAGAGMGVDSGLPDFRGPEGLWRAYPPLKRRNLTLPETSTPHWFDTDPHFAWGFFGHRYHLYTGTTPHQGFKILKKWCNRMECGYFVFTSNVDGHFQKSGFPEHRVVECHGSINFLQGTRGFNQIWPVPADLVINVDEATLLAQAPLPTGPPDTPEKDQVLARPNILMFNDFTWLSERQDVQEERMQRWLRDVWGSKTPITVIEIGSSSFVPTVRNVGETIAMRHTDSCLIRINVRDPEVRWGKDISVPMTGLAALEQMDALVDQLD